MKKNRKLLIEDILAPGIIQVIPPVLILNIVFVSIGLLRRHFSEKFKWIHRLWYLLLLPACLGWLGIITVTREPLLLLAAFFSILLLRRFLTFRTTVLLSVSIFLSFPNFYYYNRHIRDGEVPEEWGWQPLLVHSPRGEDWPIMVHGLTTYEHSGHSFVAASTIPPGPIRGGLTFPSVYLFDVTNPEGTLRVHDGGFATYLEYDPVSKLLYSATHGFNQINAFDPESLAPVLSIDAGNSPQNLIALPGENKIALMSETTKIRLYPTQMTMTPEAMVPQKIVDKIDSWKHTFVWGLDFVHLPDGGFAVASGGPLITRLRTNQSSYDRFSTAGLSAWGVTYAESTDRLYYTDGLLGMLYEVDPVSLATTDRLFLSGGIRYVVLDKQAGLLYINQFIGEKIFVVQLKPFELVATYAAPASIRRMSLLDNGFLVIGSSLGIYMKNLRQLTLDKKKGEQTQP